MTKNLLVLLFITLILPLANAQMPKNIGFNRTTNNVNRLSCNYNAGTVVPNLVPSAQSNDKVYLCYGDTLNIIHNRDTVLSVGDPNPLTLPGIVYIYYNCPPTVNGPTVNDIKLDPCIDKSTIKVNGNPIPPSNGMWILGDDNSPTRIDAKTYNDGFPQSAWNNGNPVSFYFAPVTIDDRLNVVNPMWEGNPIGSCVDLNTTSAFRVVYLNEIKQSAATVPGTFTISGGLSEFDNKATNYTITIEKTTDATKKGIITTGAVGHGSVVKYTVPESGTYRITVEDGKSCGTTFTQTFAAPPVQFFAPTVSAKPGQTICVDITVKDFINITSGQFTMSFDTSVMKFSSIQAGNIPGVSQSTFGTTSNLVNMGKVTVAYDAPSASLPNGITAADGSIFAKICFVINNYATTGQSSPIKFDGSKTNIAFENKDGNITFQNTDGKITITTGPLFTVDLTATNTSCKNSNDGAIKVTATGGIVPYKVKWQLVPLGTVFSASDITTNGGMSPISGLAAGTYSVTVTDATGIPEIQTVEIQPTATIGANLMFIKKPSCAGKNDGQVYVEVLLNNSVVNNPTPPLYTFAWSNGSTNDTVSGLKAGFIEVFVFRKINGCTDTAKASGTITEPLPLSLKINKQDISCITNTGQAGVSVSGGTPNYTYKWSDNQTNATASGLSSGFIKVTVTDANKCTDTISTTILPPNKPKIDSIVSVDAKCYSGNTGSVTVYAKAGGSPIANYNWSNSQSGATLNSITSLIAGTYTVTVTGLDGCTSTAQKIVNEPPVISIDSFTVEIPKCKTAPLNKGTLQVYVTGGTGSYTYYWSSSLFFADTTNFPLQVGLSPAFYSVTIQDANGCRINQTNMQLPKAPDFNITFPPSNTISVKCNNGTPCDGQAVVTPIGGNNSLYKYVWSSGETNNNTPESKAIKLCQGWQSVTVTDGFCNIIDSVFIKAPEVLTLDTASVVKNDVSCFGSKDGKITAVAKGGVQPYSFSWPFFGNLQGNTIDKLLAGTYGVIITDANGCKTTQNITITEPSKLVASIDPSNTSSVKCFGDNNGVITVVCSNCQGTATYIWPNNAAATTENSASNLAPGLYVITVTDSKNCSDTARIVLTNPAPIVSSIPFPEPPLCYGYQTVIQLDTAYGGSGGPFKFSVDDGPKRPVTELYDVYAGKHIVKIFDNNDCYKTDTITILDPPKVIVYLGNDTVINLGDSLLLTPQIISILPIDTLIWSPLTNLNPSDRDGLLAPYVRPSETTTYKLLVYDSNNCPGEDEIKINIDRNRNVYIPNVFHANEGDLNRSFRVFIGPGVEKINYTRIYDRWGDLVYSDKSNKPEWDGTCNGRKMNPGVYVYVVEVLFIDNVKLVYRGDVTLLR